jgi:hypothetical protein
MGGVNLTRCKSDVKIDCPSILGTFHGARILFTHPRFPALARAPSLITIGALIGVLGMTIGVPFLLAFVTGSVAIPHNDAWAYSRIAETFARGEGLQLLGWNRVFLLGQVVLFGQSPSIAGQHATVNVLAAGGLVAVFFLLKHLVGDARALFGTAVMGLVPGFGLLATSFMTDVPAWACGTASLAISFVAIRRVAPSALAVGLAIGVAGATCRDDAIVAPVAALIAAAAAWRRDRAAMRLLFVEALAVLIVFGGLQTWRRQMEHGDELTLTLNVFSTAFTSVRAYFTLALFLAPAAAFAVRPGEWSRSARLCALGVAAVGLPFYAQLRGDMMLGNYVSRYGAYEVVAVGTREVIPRLAWLTAVGASYIAGISLAGHLVTHWRQLNPLLSIFTVLTATAMIGLSLIGQPSFDRYLLPLVMPLAVLLLRGDRPRWGPALAVLAGQAALSLALTANGLAFDGARWAEGLRLQHAGTSVADINAGLEWVGYHSPAAVDRSLVSDRSPVGWWMQLFPQARECYVVTASARPDLGSAVSQSPYRAYAVFGEAWLWTYRLDPCR